MQMLNPRCLVVAPVSIICGALCGQTAFFSSYNRVAGTGQSAVQAVYGSSGAMLVAPSGSVSTLCKESDEESKNIIKEARHLAEKEKKDVEGQIREVEDRMQRRSQASDEIKKLSDLLAPDREEFAKVGEYGVYKGYAQIVGSAADVSMDVLGRGSRVVEAGYTVAKYASKVVLDNDSVTKNDTGKTLALTTSKLDVPYKTFPGGYVIGVDLDAFPGARKIGNAADRLMTVWGFKEGIENVRSGAAETRDAANLLASERRLQSDVEYKLYKDQLRDQVELDALKSELGVIKAREEKLVTCGLQAPPPEEEQSTPVFGKPVSEEAPTIHKSASDSQSRIDELAKLEVALGELKGDNPVLVASLRASVQGGAVLRQVGPGKYKLEYPDSGGNLKIDSPVMDFGIMNQFSEPKRNTDGDQLFDSMDQALARWKQGLKKHVGSRPGYRNRQMSRPGTSGPQLTNEYRKYESLCREAIDVMSNMSQKNGHYGSDLSKLEAIGRKVMALDPTRFVSNPTADQLVDMEDRISWMQDAMQRARNLAGMQHGSMEQNRATKDAVNWMAATTPDANKEGVERFRSDFEKKADNYAAEQYRKQTADTQADLSKNRELLNRERRREPQNEATERKIQRLQADIAAGERRQAEYDQHYSNYRR